MIVCGPLKIEHEKHIK